MTRRQHFRPESDTRCMRVMKVGSKMLLNHIAVTNLRPVLVACTKIGE